MTSHAGDGCSSRRQRFSQEAIVPLLALLAKDLSPVTGAVPLLGDYLRHAVNPVQCVSAFTRKDLFKRGRHAPTPQTDKEHSEASIGKSSR